MAMLPRDANFAQSTDGGIQRLQAAPIRTDVGVVEPGKTLPGSPRPGSASDAIDVPRVDLGGTPRDILVALTYGLELVRHGAMLVAEQGRPQLANRAAYAILQKKDGILLSQSCLVADRAADTRMLHKLLKDAIRTPELGEPKESPLALERRISKTSLIVRVVPGPGLDCAIGASGRTALLTLYDQDAGLIVDEHALSTLYGLTRGEAALASRLVQGKSIEEAAQDLFISTHTARTHLKRIFMKTDTHRQTELVVRMLLTAV